MMESFKINSLTKPELFAVGSRPRLFWNVVAGSKWAKAMLRERMAAEMNRQLRKELLERVGCSAQPFTAPAVRPEMIRRWKRSTSTTSGRVITIEAAVI